MILKSERARYCQQHRESVNNKIFDQSEYDTGASYNGGIKDLSPCSATLSPSLRPPLDSIRSPIFFLFDPVLLAFPLMLSIAERSIDNAAIHFSLSRPRSMDTRETERMSFFFFF